MPRKTRQEKILAQLRRLQKDQSQTNPDKKPEPESSTVSLNLEPLTAPTISQPKPTQEDYGYVISDLKKTTFFAAAAITFQIALSFIL